MKYVGFAILLLTIAITSFSQNKSLMHRSWIKTSIENLSNQEIGPDTLYTRYTFAKTELHISFYPAWNDYHMPWSLSGNHLTIGFDTYRVEELTDTSLTIALDGFRRFKFVSEEYLNSKEENLLPLGEYNGKPLYKANDFISPRYKKGSLRTVMQQNLERYNIKKTTYFSVTFVVTEEGKVQNVQVVNGITVGFDREVVKQLLKTSKDWVPARFRGQAVQTQMLYDIKYLDSITSTSSGILN